MLEAPSPADVPAAEFETVIGLEVHAPAAHGKAKLLHRSPTGSVTSRTLR